MVLTNEDKLKYLQEKIIPELLSHSLAWPFNKPPSINHDIDFVSIIQNLIDLGTIRSRISNQEYKTAEEVVSDLELMFENCIKYNPAKDDFVKLVLNLQTTMRRLLKQYCIISTRKRNISIICSPATPSDHEEDNNKIDINRQKRIIELETPKVIIPEPEVHPSKIVKVINVTERPKITKAQVYEKINEILERKSTKVFSVRSKVSDVGFDDFMVTLDVDFIAKIAADKPVAEREAFVDKMVEDFNNSR